MKKLIRSLLVALGLASAGSAAADEIPVPGMAESDHFRAEEVWSYKARAGEESSRVAIGRIDSLPGDTIAVHVKIVGLRLRNSNAPAGITTVMGHAPILESALLASVLERVDEEVDLDGFDEGYKTWLAAYLEGEAGLFSMPLAEIVSSIEATLSR